MENIKQINRPKEEKKKLSILDEVIDEIETALQDPRGLIYHQRRIAFALSLGSVELLEHYLKRLNVFKIGAKINHLWLKKKKENVKPFISRSLTCPIDNINKIDKLLELAYKIEEERNLQAYGKQVSDEIIREKINLFFELKKECEND
jgi:hypothetical protein